MNILQIKFWKYFLFLTFVLALFSCSKDSVYAPDLKQIKASDVMQALNSAELSQDEAYKVSVNSTSFDAKNSTISLETGNPSLARPPLSPTRSVRIPENEALEAMNGAQNYVKNIQEKLDNNPATKDLIKVTYGVIDAGIKNRSYSSLDHNNNENTATFYIKLEPVEPYAYQLEADTIQFDLQSPAGKKWEKGSAVFINDSDILNAIKGAIGTTIGSAGYEVMVDKVEVFNKKDYVELTVSSSGKLKTSMFDAATSYVQDLQKIFDNQQNSTAIGIKIVDVIRDDFKGSIAIQEDEDNLKLASFNILMEAKNGYLLGEYFKKIQFDLANSEDWTDPIITGKLPSEVNINKLFNDLFFELDDKKLGATYEFTVGSTKIATSPHSYQVIPKNFKGNNGNDDAKAAYEEYITSLKTHLFDKNIPAISSKLSDYVEFVHDNNSVQTQDGGAGTTGDPAKGCYFRFYVKKRADSPANVNVILMSNLQFFFVINDRHNHVSHEDPKWYNGRTHKQ